MALHYVVRDAADEHHGFIASSFVATVRMSMPKGHVSRMPDGAFQQYHYTMVSRLLARCRIRVAVSESDESNVYGFSIIGGKHVWCVYVSKSHWRLGIGKSLLPTNGIRDMVLRLWPNTTRSDTEWMYTRLEQATYLPYWMEADDG